MELVKKQLKKRRSGEEHEKLQHLLQRMVRRSEYGAGGDSQSLPFTCLTPLISAPQEQQEMAQKERKRQQELRLALKQERRAQAQQGHRPYFLKKCEWGTATTHETQGQKLGSHSDGCCVRGSWSCLREA